MTPIEELNLNTRALNTLLRNHIYTTEDLATKSEEELLTYANLGRTTLTDIRIALREAGHPDINIRQPRHCPHCGKPLD